MNYSSLSLGSHTFQVESEDQAGNISTPASYTWTINATPTVTVTDASGPYTSLAFLAAGSVTGVGGANLGTPVFTYYVGTGTNGTDLGSAAPYAAGNYTVVASFAGNADYTPASSNPLNFTISAATVNYTIGNDSQTYGNAANLAHDLGTTIPTGVNGQTLDIAYSSRRHGPCGHVRDHRRSRQRHRPLE